MALQRQVAIGLFARTRNRILSETIVQFDQMVHLDIFFK